MKYKCLSIAGFDGSGGAGLQADLKTFSALGCYGMNVLTALPVQNTCGVKCCYEVPISSIQEQLECIFDDIVPDAIKIGMLYSSAIIALVVTFLQERAKDIPIVLDPVMVAKNGNMLLQDEAIDALKTLAIPMATIVTPNLPEALTLAGERHQKRIIAEKILALGCGAVLLKGGHESGLYSVDTYLDNNGNSCDLSSQRIMSNNTHGTGCTLSAAITSFLAQGIGLVDACRLAKQYLSGALLAAQDNSVGNGHGPVHHFYQLWSNNMITGRG